MEPDDRRPVLPAILGARGRSIPRPAEGPPITLQWLPVRASPNHGREIRPPAHSPPWDDARTEAQRRAVTSISHVVLVCRLGFDSGNWATAPRPPPGACGDLRTTNSHMCRCIGARLGTTGWGERHGVLSMRVPGPLWRRPRYSPCTGRSVRRWESSPRTDEYRVGVRS